MIFCAEDHWFNYTLPANNKICINVNHAIANANIDSELYTSCATFPLLSALSFTDNETINDLNTSGATQNLKLRVFVVNQGGCSTYSLNVTREEFPCLTDPNDVLEPNNSCGQATPLPSNSFTTDLVLRAGDIDHDSFDVEAGATHTVDVLISHAEGDLFAQFFDGACGYFMVSGSTLSDNEQIAFTNNTGATRTYQLLVAISPLTTGPCANYSLLLSPSEFSSVSNGDGSDQKGSELVESHVESQRLIIALVFPRT